MLLVKEIVKTLVLDSNAEYVNVFYGFFILFNGFVFKFIINK